MVDEKTRFMVLTSTEYYITPTLTLTEDQQGVSIIDVNKEGVLTKMVIPLESVERIIKECYTQEDITSEYTQNLTALN